MFPIRFLSRRSLFLACVHLCWPDPPVPSVDFDDVKIEATDLGGGIHMLNGAGGNLGVCVGEDGVFLIDDQYAPLSEKIMAAIGELSDQPVQFVFNTHWHGDHTGGNENFGETRQPAGFPRQRSAAAVDRAVHRVLRPHHARRRPTGALPVVTFTDSVSFFYNDEEIVVFHVPAAHTDGDGVVHFTKANIIHSGDIIFYGLYPYIDVSAGGSIDGVIAGVKISWT